MDTTAEPASESRQFGLVDVFGWFVYCGAFFAVMAAYPVIAKVVQQQEVATSLLIAPSVCWLIMLVYFVRQRHTAAVVVHVLPVAMVGLVAVLAGWESQSLLIVTAPACWICSVFSFLMSLSKSMERGVQRQATPAGYLTYKLIGACLLGSAICVAPGLLLWGRLYSVHWQAAVFGALVGIWAGLHQAVATSPELRERRLGGAPLRPTVAAGFVGAVLGPLLCWIVNQLFFSYRWSMLGLSPLLFGLPTALLAALVARKRG